MKTNSKRWRRYMRFRFRRSRARARRVLARPVTTELQSDRFNIAAEWLNKRVRFPRERGIATIGGCVACPKCGADVLMFADPQEWAPNNKVAWRRGKENTWQVVGYWGRTGQCCGLLLAFQPDGTAECYSLEPKETSNIQHSTLNVQ